MGASLTSSPVKQPNSFRRTALAESSTGSGSTRRTTTWTLTSLHRHIFTPTNFYRLPYLTKCQKYAKVNIQQRSLCSKFIRSKLPSKCWVARAVVVLRVWLRLLPLPPLLPTTTTSTRAVVLLLLQNATISTLAERILVVQLARDQERSVHVQKTFPKMYPKSCKESMSFISRPFQSDLAELPQ